jgi:predicted acylesterase/phospholipase RssA
VRGWHVTECGLPLRRTVARAALTAMVALLPAATHAQHSLVLSGGGARGLSHAGAIVALEELGYRPAFVVGTSMGAIVGALYAAGYQPTEIRDIIGRENWLERFAAEPLLLGPDRNARRALFGFGINRGRFYGGFIAETGINQRLIELLFDAGVRAGNDFDALPLSYRAVAADLATGAEVVLAAGDLPRAVRASMAVPGVFAPVRWNERVLVDGGVANNLPVSVARGLSDAPVIAIDVLRPAERIEERGALDIGVRALRLLIENARPDVGSDADILVLPPLRPGLSETAFPADASGLIATGYAAVRDQVAPTVQQPVATRTRGAAPDHIDALRIENAGSATERLVLRMMRGAVREYDPVDISARVAALHMTGLFQSVWPRVERDDDDATLVVDVTRVASSSVAAAARWDNDVGAAGWLSLRQHVELRTPVELRLAATFDQLGQDGALDASFFSALVPGLTWNGGGHAVERRIRIFDSDSILARPFSRRVGAWIGAELHGPLDDWFVSAHARADHIRDPLARGWAIGPFVRIARSPAPDRVVGIDPVAQGEVRGADLEYQRAELSVGPAFRLQRLRFAPVLVLAAASRATPLHALPAADQTAAPWLAAGAWRSRRLVATGFDVAVPIVMNGYVRARVRAAAVAPTLDDLRRSRTWSTGAEIGAIWPTVLGPITTGFAASHRGERRFNLGLGAAF